MVIQVLITALLVLMNGFFVAAEFAIVKVRLSQLEVKATEGNKSANMARHIVSHLDGYLAATQLGITLASLGLGWIGEPVVSKMIINIMDAVGISVSEATAHNIALPVAFAIITILHIVFGELAPKSIAIQRSQGTTLAVAYPLQFFFVVFRPFIWILNGIANRILRLLGISAVHGSEVHSSEEMKYLVQQSQESGSIEEAEYDLIISAFNFSERTVKQILLHRSKVSAVDIDDPFDDQLEKIFEDGYSRYPVYEETLDNIIGIVNTKDVLMALRKRADVGIKDLLRDALFVPENMHIRTLLKEFQRKRQHIAIVVDEYGNTEGIASLEDVLEQLVGEIQDEYDNENSPVQRQPDGSFIVQAQEPILDINHQLPVELQISDDYTTIAGAVINKLQRIPAVGEKLRLEEYEVFILAKDGNSVLLVRMALVAEDDEP